MQLKQNVFSGILSIAMALFTLFFIERMGYADDIQQYFFGGISDLGQLEKFVGKNYYEGIKSIMLLIFAFFVTYICFFVFFFELIALGYFLITSKWLKPSVFISYKKAEAGARVNTDKIALALKTDLEQKGFKVLFFQYTTKLDHDNVNFQIQKLLRQAHAMIVIPDPYHPSYVNSEILCAVNSFKPVYILKHTKDQKLPDTANSGHTVLLLDKLKKEKYQPLSYILQYVHKVWHKRLFIIGMPLTSFLFPFLYLEEADGDFFKAILAFGFLTALLVYFKLPILTVLLVVKIIITLLGVVGAYVTMSAIFANIRFQKVIKQSMINAGNTYDYFVAAGFDKKILDCIDKVGLEK
ncbi:MAG: hypothetical protein JWQ09_4092 [Segetibacter sp.]|nr:hypothetical protein [Segetibacter sp.]